MAGRMTYVEAIREALAEEMERDDRVLFMGQDVGRYGGLFVSHVVLSTSIL
jgi:pyruvate/2-oxoglutarate/acetoin dehydrogenase E1 component